MKSFAELDIVQLQQAHPECGLPVGALGTVVLVYQRGEAYEVEFVRPDGSTQAVLTLPAAEVAAPATHAVQQAAELLCVFVSFSRRGPGCGWFASGGRLITAPHGNSCFGGPTRAILLVRVRK